MKRNNLLLIGKDLVNFDSVAIHCDVLTINVHCNDITQINGLERASRLTELDVSSNKLTSMSGLSHLKCLVYLNLASNFITEVTGLAGLTTLKYLNLSYNMIRSMHGMLDMHGQSYQLQSLELHGNNLIDLKHIISCLDGILALKHLTLKYTCGDNPVTSMPKYREILLRSLPQLVTLDCINRSNELCKLPLVLIDDSTDLKQEISSRPTISENKKNLAVAFDIGSSMNTGLPDPENGKTSSWSFSVFEGSDISKNTTSAHAIIHEVKTESKVAKPQSCAEKQENVCVALKQGRSLKSKTKLAKRKVHRKVSGENSFHNQSVEKQTYLNLVSELESEREHRWKAEQACKSFLAVVQHMEAESSRGTNLQQVAAETAERLKKRLLAEQCNNERLRQDNNKLSQKILKLNKEIAYLSDKSNSNVSDLKKSLAEAHGRISELQTSFSKQQKDLETERQLSVAERKEMAIKKDELQKKVEHFQDLFLSKEEEHLNLKSLMTLQITEEENKLKQKVLVLEQKLSNLQSEYSNLESEFREALRIESERYKQVFDKCNEAALNLHHYKSLLDNAMFKEGKCRSMLAEMTSIIKEQKAKISELFLCKEEVGMTFQTQLKSLQEENKEHRKRSLQTEHVQQHNSKLLSKVTALQSLVNGLKEERKVWGEELAEQGSALSQDRGRLEMKIEYLQAEVASLNTNNQRDLDALRIKTKIVEDQAQTIVKMKEALLLKDKEIKTRLEEELITQKQLEDAAESLTKENTVLHQEKQLLVKRKYDLKSELAQAMKRCDMLEKKYEEQRMRWSEKGTLLSQLELQVRNIQETGKQQEIKLMKERNNALQDAHEAKLRIDTIKSEFEEQLKASCDEHQHQVELMRKDKHDEVDLWKTKVATVENEMREVLHEQELLKKQTDIKVGKLKFMLEEFQ